jgi:hypothetical protein
MTVPEDSILLHLPGVKYLCIGATYLIAALRVGFRVDPQQCNKEVRGTHATPTMQQ